MLVRTKPVIDYAKFDTAEHQDWKQHREALHLVGPEIAQNRGCAGLAMIVDATTEDSWVRCRGNTFLPDSGLRWASMVDVPGWAYRDDGHRRERHLAAVRPTSMTYGSPKLLRPRKGTRCWDFRRFPFDTKAGKTGKAKPTDDTLSPSRHPQLFRLFNAMEWAMTSTAFAVHPEWRKRREHFHKLVNKTPEPDEQGVFLFGSDTCGYKYYLPHPVKWMPVPYLAFREKDSQYLFEAITNIGRRDTHTYPVDLRDAFLDALGDNLRYVAKFDGCVKSVTSETYYGVPVHRLVLKGDRGEHETVRLTQTAKKHITSREFKEGTLIAEENVMPLPAAWADTWRGAQWKLARETVGNRRLDAIIRMWFERERLRIVPDLVHFPAKLAITAAFRAGVDRGLMWDVSRSQEYYNDGCDSFVFPPILLDRWDDFEGRLPGFVAYDLTPSDIRVRLSR